MAKSSKRPNIREYSNGYRLIHHQNSISKFREKDGLVPCAEDGEHAGKTNTSFLFNLVELKKQMICLTVVGWCDKMKVMLVWRINLHLEVFYEHL